MKDSVRRAFLTPAASLASARQCAKSSTVAKATERCAIPRALDSLNAYVPHNSKPYATSSQNRRSRAIRRNVKAGDGTDTASLKSQNDSGGTAPSQSLDGNALPFLLSALSNTRMSATPPVCCRQRSMTGESSPATSRSLLAQRSPASGRRGDARGFLSHGYAVRQNACEICGPRYKCMVRL